MPYSHAPADPFCGRYRRRAVSAAANVSAVRSAASSASRVRRAKKPSSSSTWRAEKRPKAPARPRRGGGQLGVARAPREEAEQLVDMADVEALERRRVAAAEELLVGVAPRAHIRSFAAGPSVCPRSAPQDRPQQPADLLRVDAVALL